LKSAEKYLWQQGWWLQHQRFLGALQERPQRRIIFSGDIHAQGAVSIRGSGSLDFRASPIVSVLVGPVGTSQGTWPSFAREITASQPEWMKTNELAETREVNGFALFDFVGDKAHLQLFDCGGYDLEKDEDGSVLSIHAIELA
jgi:hypothetical protein